MMCDGGSESMARQELYVADLMTRNVLTVKPDDRVVDHLDIFKQHGIHHVPVTDAEGHVVGLVSAKDLENYVNIVKILQDRDNPVTIKDIMTTPVFTYSEEIGIDAAAQAMIDNDIHAIVIRSRKEELAGILTSTDLLRHLANRDRWKNF